MGGPINPIRCVLIVDDDARILAAFQRRLRGTRRVVTTGYAATACALAVVEKPDLVIVDLKLDAASGIDLVRDLRAALQDVALVLISGCLSIATAQAALRAGANLVFSKPVTPDEILFHIEGGTAPEPTHETLSLERVEFEHIERVLSDCGGNISETARRLKIHRHSLQRKLARQPPRT